MMAATIVLIVCLELVCCTHSLSGLHLKRCPPGSQSPAISATFVSTFTFTAQEDTNSLWRGVGSWDRSLSRLDYVHEYIFDDESKGSYFGINSGNASAMYSTETKPDGETICNASAPAGTTFGHLNGSVMLTAMSTENVITLLKGGPSR